MITNNLKLIASVSLDFYNNNIKTINVKQYDSKSRYIQVSFTEHGKKVELNKDAMSVIARYKKADGKFGLIDCEILDDGTVMIQTTEQMLAVSGRCRLDVVILQSNGLIVENYCDVTSLDDIDCAILSTMPLDLNVVACPVSDGELQSEYDFTALNSALVETKEAEKDLIAKNIQWDIAENGKFDEFGNLIEDGRVQVEQKRVDAETARNETEKLRNIAENGKFDESGNLIEDGRIQAEQKRVDAENARAEAETSRVEAETQRNQNIENLINDCQNKVNNATTDANNAANRAIEAAQDCENIVAGIGIVMQTEKGAADGVASLDETGKIPLEQIPDGIQAAVDWNAPDSSNGAVKNKPPVENGAGVNSVIIGVGNAEGDYSVAGGSNNSDEIDKAQAMAQLAGYVVDTDNATAYGAGSLAFGVGSKTYSMGSLAIGISNSAGAKGFYWHSIDWSGTNPIIQLSTEQKPYRYYSVLGQKIEQNKTATWTTEAASLLSNWTVGDALTIVNDIKYGEKAVITAIDSTSGKITVESLPFAERDVKVAFTSLSDITALVLLFDNISIYNPSKPSAGVIEFAYGALSLGAMSKASGLFSSALGYGTRVTTDFGHAEGRETVAGYAAHAEGQETKAIGINSHAEGARTIASAVQAHAEGYETQAIEYCSHAEGQSTCASGGNSHAEGSSTTSKGNSSHAEGSQTTAMGQAAHAEGYRTTASGGYSHAEGMETTATRQAAHAEGYNTTADASYSHAEGMETTATRQAAHAEGYRTTASGGNSHAEGHITTASGDNSHAEGYRTTASGGEAHAEGYETEATGNVSHAEGKQTKATKHTAHAEGYNTTADGENSHAEGYYTVAAGSCAHAEGSITYANAWASHAEGERCYANAFASHVEGGGCIASSSWQHVQGKYNDPDSGNTYVHIIGFGISDEERQNTHTVEGNGTAWYAGSITSNGADYAEYFEWQDGNLNNEDRVGLLVALDGEKIKLANTGDEILGVISGTAAVLGDNYECSWQGRFLTDDFGRVIYEGVEEFVDAVTGEDEEGNPIVEKKSLGFFKHPKQNPEYDSSKEYIRRSDRPEWDTVGMLGKLYVRDDGTATVNGYVTVGENGVATSSSEKTNMRVLSRVNDNVIRILLR